MEPRHIGRYEIEESLGEGGMGMVYKAYDPQMDRYVAIKKVAFQDDLQRARFQQEVKAAGNFNSPHIVTIYDTWVEDNVGYIVMELVAGETLADRLTAPIPWREAIELILPICQALAEAHHKGVIHRDVKPANILISNEGRVKLTDFGVARLDTTQGRITTGEKMVGTFYYVAPEQARNEAIDGRADIFSLGIVLYEMITGRHPFEGGNLYQVLNRIAEGEPADLTALEYVAPTSVVELISRALNKAPSDRHASAEEMGKALTGCLADSTPSLLPSPPSPPPSDPDQFLRLKTVSNISLSAAEEALLRKTFAGYEALHLEHEFKKGFSGARVLLATPVRLGGKPEAQIVLKLDTPAAVDVEWQAYRKHVRQKLQMTAHIPARPDYADDRQLALLRYTFAGGWDETVSPESLQTFYKNHSGREVARLLERYVFEAVRDKWWEQRQTKQFFLRDEFDRLFPVHLEVKPAVATASATLSLIAGKARFNDCSHLAPAQTVQIEGFAVEEIRPRRGEMTLSAPLRSHSQGSPLRIRVVALPPDQRAYSVGEIVPPFTAVVTHTRDSLLHERARPAFPDQDLRQAELLIGGQAYPNPLQRYEQLLDKSFRAMGSTIHGDLNLENILVAPPSGPAWLIDFATTREGYTLFDFLRLETQIITKGLADLPAGPEAVVQLLKALHAPKPAFGQLPTNLSDPFQVLVTIRHAAQNYLLRHDSWDEYYDGLALMLMGALKFKELSIPARQITLAAAAAALNLVGQPLVEGPPLPQGPSEATPKTSLSRRVLAIIGGVLGVVGITAAATWFGFGGQDIDPIAAIKSPTITPTETIVVEPLSPPTPIPQPTPTDTPTPIVIIPDGIVLDPAEIRSGPGESYLVVGQVVEGNPVQVRGQNESGDWFQIAYPGSADGVGWVPASLIRLMEQTPPPIVLTPTLPPTPPTSTPSPTPDCPPSTYFQPATAGDANLGCTQEAWRSDFTLQRFTGGLMIWRKEPAPAEIYILYEDGTWRKEPDPIGPAFASCAEAEQTGGLGPSLSFGLIWCQDEKSRLGAPLTGEIAFADSPVERFEGGLAVGLGQTGYLLQAENARWRPFSLASTDPNDYQLFFAANLDGEYRIYKMKLSDSQPTRLTDGPGDEGRPALSPDGRYLAFGSTRNGKLDIFVLDLVSQDIKQLTTDPAHDHTPAWSPDGRHIAFQSERAGNYDIYLMRADGSNQVALTTDQTDDYWPAWSPDGRQILFESRRADGKHIQLYVMNADGSQQTRLTTSAADDGMPAWSSTGQIAFYSNRAGNRELYLLENLEAEPVRLTENEGNDWFPAWSPDGGYLTFASGANKQARLKVMDMTSRNISELTSFAGDTSDPVIAFAVQPIAAPHQEGMIEDFEGYNTASLQQTYTLNNAWDKNEIAIDVVTLPGQAGHGQVLAVDYNIKNAIPPDDYVGLERKSLQTQDWSAFNAVRYWVQNDNTAKTLVFQWGEAAHGSNEIWKSQWTVQPNETRLIELPLTAEYFTWADWSSAGNQQLDLSQVGYYAFFLSQDQPGSGTIYLDQLELVAGQVSATRSPPSCEMLPASEFSRVWSTYEGELGCPTEPGGRITLIAEQHFERGHMFWRQDTDAVYVIYDRQKDGSSLSSGTWEEFGIPWDNSDPDGVGLTPPNGLQEPKRGFGWLWRTRLGGPESDIGWALDKEYGVENVAISQYFDNGVIFRGSDPRIYVLLNNGQFYTSN